MYFTTHRSANRIDAHTGGADNISTGAGDDLIDVDDGVGDDVVDCGENGFITDDATVFFDPGDQIASSCEEQVPVS